LFHGLAASVASLGAGVAQNVAIIVVTVPSSSVPFSSHQFSTRAFIINPPPSPFFHPPP